MDNLEIAHSPIKPVVFYFFDPKRPALNRSGGVVPSSIVGNVQIKKCPLNKENPGDSLSGWGAIEACLKEIKPKFYFVFVEVTENTLETLEEILQSGVENLSEDMAYEARPYCAKFFMVNFVPQKENLPDDFLKRCLILERRFPNFFYFLHRVNLTKYVDRCFDHF